MCNTDEYADPICSAVRGICTTRDKVGIYFYKIYIAWDATENQHWT